MISVLTINISITFNDQRFSVIAQYLLRDSAKIIKRFFQTLLSGFCTLVIKKLNVARSRIAQCCNKRFQRLLSSANDGEVDLHLLSWLCFKSYDRLRRALFEFSKITAQHRNANFCIGGDSERAIPANTERSSESVLT